MFYYGIIYREDEYEAQKWLSSLAEAGNESAAHAIKRMANHQLLAAVTDILWFLSSIERIVEYRLPQDCTTMPQERVKKKYAWEQRM